MTRCLCCNKPMRTGDGSEWHPACIRRFFGTRSLPVLETGESELHRLALESVSKRLTVTGVQKKLSLHLSSDGTNPRLTLVDYPTGFILKPAVLDYPSLPEAEHLVMSMAEAVGLKTVPHALIRGKDALAYITRRVDRTTDDSPQKLAMEDFCQLDGRLTEDKYRGSYERCAKIIDRYSSRIGLDQSEFFLRVVFSFLTGNSDMHLKNFSLLETDVGSGRYQLSPAYDLLPVNLLMPADREQTALTLNGKKGNLKRADFLALAEACQIKAETAVRLIRSILVRQPTLLKLCEDSFLTSEMKRQMSDLIVTRAKILDPSHS